MGEAKRKSERGYDLVMFAIGRRGNMTPSTCEKAAAAWRTITAENPKARFMLQVGGFDDDPRDLWEFPEVCAYVQLWARFAGLTDPDKAEVFGEYTLGFSPHAASSAKRSRARPSNPHRPCGGSQ